MTFKIQPPDIKIQSDLKRALLGEQAMLPAPATAAVFVSFQYKQAAKVARLLSALTEGGKQRQKHFWSIVAHSDVKPASLLLQEPVNIRQTGGFAGRPFWQQHAHFDESYISRKQIDAVRDEVVGFWKDLLPAPAIVDGNHDFLDCGFSDLDPKLFFSLCHEIAHTQLSARDVQRIEKMVKRAIEKRVRRIQRFIFKRTVSHLRTDDAVRVAIHGYRVRTGISPPEIEPTRATCSSNAASISISEEKYHEYVRRRANRRRFPWPAPDGCARKRRTPSRQANRHPARSHQAGGLSNCRTGTHREAPQHRAAHLLLQHRRPMVGDVPVAA